MAEPKERESATTPKNEAGVPTILCSVSKPISKSSGTALSDRATPSVPQESSPFSKSVWSKYRSRSPEAASACEWIRVSTAAVIRFLDESGCGYVMVAKEFPHLKKRARGCKFQRLQNGWQAGEFWEKVYHK